MISGRPDHARVRSLFGIAPGGACRAGPVTRPAVGFYPTVSPLPYKRMAVCFLWRFPLGCPSRALPGTLASWSPDFPRIHAQEPICAVIQPSAQGLHTRQADIAQGGYGGISARRTRWTNHFPDSCAVLSRCTCPQRGAALSMCQQKKGTWHAHSGDK